MSDDFYSKQLTLLFRNPDKLRNECHCKPV